MSLVFMWNSFIMISSKNNFKYVKCTNRVHNKSPSNELNPHLKPQQHFIEQLNMFNLTDGPQGGLFSVSERQILIQIQIQIRFWLRKWTNSQTHNLCIWTHTFSGNGALWKGYGQTARSAITARRGHEIIQSNISRWSNLIHHDFISFHVLLEHMYNLNILFPYTNPIPNPTHQTKLLVFIHSQKQLDL